MYKNSEVKLYNLHRSYAPISKIIHIFFLIPGQLERSVNDSELIKNSGLRRPGIVCIRIPVYNIDIYLT